jgi:hypothetical protein
VPDAGGGPIDVGGLHKDSAMNNILFIVLVVTINVNSYVILSGNILAFYQNQVGCVIRSVFTM